MYPKIQFKLNKELDKRVGIVFLKIMAGGLDFGKEILKTHPNLRDVKKEKDVIEYIDKYYLIHREELSHSKRLFESVWKSTEKKFFKKVTKLFKNCPWPKGKYICYLSIFPCGPRFLKNKSFQSFYKYPKDIIISQIIHEMLHFIFYDYLYKHYPKYKSNKYHQRIWEISEAFNQVIQEQRDWVSTFGEPILPYPKLKKLIIKMKKIWKKKPDIDYLLKKILLK